MKAPIKRADILDSATGKRRSRSPSSEAETTVEPVQPQDPVVPLQCVSKAAPNWFAPKFILEMPSGRLIGLAEFR
jgi:hypothetical protein